MAFDIEGHLKRIDSKLTNLLQITKKETWVKVDVLQEMTIWDNKHKLNRARKDQLVKIKKEGNIWYYELNSINSLFFKAEFRITGELNKMFH